MWCVAIELPPVLGRRRRKVVARRVRAEAVAAGRDLLREFHRSGDLVTAAPTVAAWMTTWLDVVARDRLKPRTWATYRGYVDRYILPAIGRVRLDKVTGTHVRQVHALAGGDGRSSTTALQAHRILSRAMLDAMREGLIPRNPVEFVGPPRRALGARGALTAEQARTLLLSVAHDPVEATHWTIALMTGLRQGERLGLTRDALDLDAGTIAVEWQIQRLKWQHGCEGGCGRARAGDCPTREVYIPPDQEARQVYGGLWLTRPKSRAGWRQVPIAPPLLAILREYVAAVEPGDEGLILHRGDGHPRDPRDDTAAWTAALDAAGLPRVPLHSARHTTATLLLELDVPERIRVQIMGHSSATVTAGYTHVTDPLMREAMGRLGSHIAPQIEA